MTHWLERYMRRSLAPIGALILICMLVGFPLGQSLQRLSANVAYLHLAKSLSVATVNRPFPDIIPPVIQVNSNSVRYIPLAVREAYFGKDCVSIPRLDADASKWPTSDPITDFVMGHLYYACEMSDLALMSWRKSNAFDYFLNQCADRLRQEENEQAHRDCILATQLNQNSALAFDYLGRVNTRLRDYQEAVVDYAAAIAIDESIPGLLLRAGAAYEQIGDLQTAEQMLLSALAYDSRDARVFFVLGRIAYTQSDYSKALRAVEQAIQLESTYSSAYLLLGDIQCATQELDQARASYARAEELDPTSELAAKRVGSIEIRCR